MDYKEKECEFRVVQTRSNHCREAGLLGSVNMRSVWFNPTKPSPTTVLQREQGLLGNFTWVQDGSPTETSSNYCTTEGTCLNDVWSTERETLLYRYTPVQYRIWEKIDHRRIAYKHAWCSGQITLFSGFSVGFCINEEKVIQYQLELRK